MTVRTLMLFALDGVLVTPDGASRLPGAAEALAALRQRGDVVPSLITGEPAGEARRRATEVGLERYLDFTVGAYGSDSADPARLVPIARERARDHYGDLTTVVVAATRDEVRWARPAADVVLAVVAGADVPGALLDALHTAGADHLLTGVADVVELSAAYAS
jgi:phosphoglycolate phosphatase